VIFLVKTLRRPRSIELLWKVVRFHFIGALEINGPGQPGQDGNRDTPKKTSKHTNRTLCRRWIPKSYYMDSSAADTGVLKGDSAPLLPGPFGNLFDAFRKYGNRPKSRHPWHLVAPDKITAAQDDCQQGRTVAFPWVWGEGLGLILWEKCVNAWNARRLGIEIEPLLVIGQGRRAGAHRRTEWTTTGRRHQRDKLIPQVWYKYVRVEVLIIVLDYPPIHGSPEWCASVGKLLPR
jgi:hypothetical protein